MNSKLDLGIPFKTGARTEFCEESKSTKVPEPKYSRNLSAAQSAKEAIRDLLSGCEHHRKLVLLDDILQGIRRQDIRAVQTNAFVPRAADELTDEREDCGDNMDVPTKRRRLMNGTQPNASLKITFVVNSSSR